MNFVTRFICLLLGIITIKNNSGLCEKATSRALDLSIPWRPMSSGVSNPPQNHLISVSTIDGTNKQQLYQIAQHNAQIMRQLKTLNHPSTQQQYYNSFQSSTPIYNGHKKNNNNKIPPISFMNGKQTFAGKPDFQNFFKTIHSSSTAKIPQGLLQNNNNGQGNYRLLNSSPNFRDVTLTPPPQPHSSQNTAQTPHPVINKLQAHLALLTRQANKQPAAAQSSRHENFILPGSVLSQFSQLSPPASHSSNHQKNSIGLNSQLTAPSLTTTKSFYGNHFEGFQNNQYLPPGGPNGNTAENFVLSNLQNAYNAQSGGNNNNNNNQAQVHISYHNTVKENGFPSAQASSASFPNIPPSVLSPFFQQVQQQNDNSNSNKNNNYEYTNYEEAKAEVEDEFTRHLVPPPPFKQIENSAYNGNSQLNNEHNDHDSNYEIYSNNNNNNHNNNNNNNNKNNNQFSVQNLSPLQDTNRYIYNTGPLKQTSISSTTQSPTFAEYLFPPSTDPPIDFNLFTTSKPNVFKNLNRPSESEFKQHKLMHPAYTGAKRPNEIAQQNSFLPTPQAEEDNNAITHSFFTIEDAVTSAPILHAQPSQQPSQQSVVFTSNHNNFEYNVEHFSHQDVSPSSRPKPQNNYDDEYEYQGQEDENQYYEHVEISTLSPVLLSSPRPRSTSTTTTTTTTTTPRPRPTSTTTTTTTTTPSPPKILINKPRDKIKMRRRRPKPAAENENDIRTIQSIEHEPAPTSHRTSQNHRHRARPKPIENERQQNIHTVQRQRQQPNHQQYQIETTDFSRTPEPTQYLKEIIRRPVSSTTQETKSNHFLPTVSSDSEIEINKNDIKLLESTPQNPFIETTTTDLRIPSRIRNNPHLNNINPTVEIITYTSPEGHEGYTSTVLQENEYGFDTTIPNVSTAPSDGNAIENNYDNVRHLSRFRYKEKTPVNDNYQFINIGSSKLPQTNTEYNDYDTQPPTVKIHTKLSSSTRSTSTTTTTTESPTTRKSNRNPQYDINTRPRFSVKDYRQRAGSTTTESTNSVSPESSTHSRLRFPTRNKYLTDLKKSRTKVNIDEEIVTTQSTRIEEINHENAIETTSANPRNRYNIGKERQRYSTVRSTTESTSTTPRPTISRRGANARRDFINRHRTSPTSTATTKIESPAPIIRNSSLPLRRPAITSLRQRIEKYRKKDEQIEQETFKDTKQIDEEQNNVELYNQDSVPEESSTDNYRRETSIMKIAKDDHSYRPYAYSTTTETSKVQHDVEDDNDLTGSPSEHSQRVAELTLSAHNTNFKSVNTGILSRRVPGYFTLATEDPILPIEAFFPQFKKE